MLVVNIRKGNLMKKTVLITGASRGIGRAIALTFAASGYDLILTCFHSESALHTLKQEIEHTYSVNCNVFIGDMGNPKDVSSLFKDVHQLDVLINNAGISYIGLINDMTPEQWQNVMNINLNAAFYTSRLAIPLMLRNHPAKS